MVLYIGTSSNDIIRGGSTDDDIQGRAGNDTLYGLGGIDYIKGEDGDDIIYGDDETSSNVGGDDYLEGGTGNDTIYGGPGADQLFGGAGNDILWGNGGADQLWGGDGDDVLNGGYLDTLYGGTGNDRFTVGTGNIIQLGVNLFDTDTANDWDVIEGDLIFLTEVNASFGIEAFRGYNDSDLLLVGTSSGGAEADNILNFTGIFLYSGVTIAGDRSGPMTSGGNDTITGSVGNDAILGMGGNDIIYGGDGDDVIYGGDDRANDPAGSGGARDGMDTIDGGAGRDRVVYAFDSFSNAIIGGSGGNRTVTIGGATDTLTNIEEIQFGSIRFRTFDNALLGSAGNDAVTGTANGERIEGLGGNDTLNGGAGNDILDGGLGNDTLSGSDGDDTIIYDAADTAANVTGGSGTDTLLMIGGSVPTGFNLLAQGFERAEHQETDATSQPWTTRNSVYNASWVMQSQSGTFDNADSWQSYFTAGVLTTYISYDTGTNDFAYANYQNNYTSAGVHISTTGVNDNGTTFSTSLDYTNTNPWVSLTTTFSATNASIAILQNGTYDNGDTWVSTYWDNGFLKNFIYYDTGVNDQSYENYTNSYAYIYNAQGNQTSTVGTYDDGRTWATSLDYDNSAAWTSLTTTLNSNGMAILQNGTYDNGDTWVSTYHSNGNLATYTYYDNGVNDQPYNYYILSYNTAGVVTSNQGQYDDGSTWFFDL